MKKITGILFVREESETEYRRWDTLTKEEVERISNFINQEAAIASGFRKVATA